jgi:hypothetical protein
VLDVALTLHIIFLITVVMLAEVLFRYITSLSSALEDPERRGIPLRAVAILDGE